MRGSYGPFVGFSAFVFLAAGAGMLWTVVQGGSVIASPNRGTVTGGAAPTPSQPSTTDGTPVAGSTAVATYPSGAPKAARKDHTIATSFGASRVDPYYWLREKDNPEVLAYLKAENDYATQQLSPTTPLREEIAKELTERANVEDVEVPYAKDGYFYQTQYQAGADYPVIVRRQGSPDGAETVVLNVPELAEGHEQYFLRNWEVSPDGAKVAFAVDFNGSRICEIFVRDLNSGAVTSTGIKDADGSIVWSADNSALLYGHLDDTLRTDQIKRHTLGSQPSADTVVLTEGDNTMSLSIGTAKSKKYAIVTIYHLQRTELQAIALDVPNAQPVMLVPRSKNTRAFADHLDGQFFIITNENAPDQKVVAVPDSAPSSTGAVVVPEVKGHYLNDFVLFRGRIAVSESHDAVQTVRVVDLATGQSRSMSPDVIGETNFDRNEDPSLPTLRLTFEKPNAPPIVYDLDLQSGAATELKRDPAWTWYNPELYETQRIQAPAQDGTQVPVTLVWRKDQKKPGGNPTLVYAYGAYGITSGPGFYRGYVSLLDRGFVLAIAHVRGGRDMGDAWYQGGRMANKMNTFTDFVAASKAVSSQGFADPSKVYAYGGSAGGLLMGAVANLSGETYDGIVAAVPFVDVLTTMLDDTIPLTTFEYEEWGNPNIQEQYEWMAAYSPYDNVTAKAYPAMYVFTGLHDSQVAYFEPAKWVAKLRATKTDQNPLLFAINMDAGHSGNSGRTGRVDDNSKMFAWLLDRAAK